MNTEGGELGTVTAKAILDDLIDHTFWYTHAAVRILAIIPVRNQLYYQLSMHGMSKGPEGMPCFLNDHC